MAYEEFLKHFEEEIRTNRLVLPSLPESTARLRALLNDPDASFDAIAELIGRDVNYASRVIKVANSAFYGRGQPITSVLAAINRLGLKQVRTLVTGLAIVQGVFQPSEPSLLRRIAGVLQHSVGIAALSQLLAERFTRLDALEVGLGGLMHDIGKLPILHWVGRHPKIAENERYTSVLTDTFSGVLGRQILVDWGFPAAFADVALAGAGEEGTVPSDSPYLELVDWAHHLSEVQHATPARAAESAEGYRRRLGAWAVAAETSPVDVVKESEALAARRAMWAA